MTRDLILAMEAGPEMDALVAEQVMAWRRHLRNTAHWTDAASENRIGDYTLRATSDWSPSRDIAAAWAVLRHLVGKQHHRVVINDGGENRMNPGYVAWVRERFEIQIEPDLVFCVISGPALDTRGFATVRDLDGLPLAICRAALLTTLEADRG